MCKRKAKKPAEGGALDSDIAVFMDDANDDDLADLKDVYEKYGDGSNKSKEKIILAINSKKNTALHLAAHNGNSDVCVQLIDWAK
jgi:predicted house-cleaning noncanonical NTP pyrophosphatase (MazG superfamily)